MRSGAKLPSRRVINKKETFNKGKKFPNKVSPHKCKHCGAAIFSSNIFCNIACFNKYKHKQNYENFIQHPEKYARASYSPKTFKDDILAAQGGVCAICGMKPFWNGKPLVFILDHIDGHASNNSVQNLRLICSNCDSQLDTYKSKNKNGERSYYRYRRSASKETLRVENPLNGETLTDDADGNSVPS